MTCPKCNRNNPDSARFCGACGSTLSVGHAPTAAAAVAVAPEPPPSADAMAGKMIGQGRYKIIKKLGQGGMGTVYRAEQISLKRAVALKVLDPNLFHDTELVRRFNTEAELAAKLSHPHTVTLYDFGEAEGGLLFIAMELLEGRSLRDVIATDAPLPPARVLDIADQVASSLADAHKAGIVHRDLKPDNVMLQERAGRKDYVRVLDFGIAKLRDERNGGVSVMQHTAAGQLLGTPHYMSPEQIMAEKVDGRTDVYALGVMMYEMVCGRPPFEAQNLMALLSMHMHDAPPPPQSKRPGLVLPPQLGGFIMRCFQKNREQRPPHMEAVIAQIQAIKSQLGISGPGPSGPRPAMAPPPGVPRPTPWGPGPQPQFTPPGAQPPPVITPRPPFQAPPGFPSNPNMSGPGAPPVASVAQPTPGFPPDLRYAPPTPARKGSLLWLWLTLGGVGVLVIILVIVGMNKKSGEEREAENLLEKLRELDLQKQPPGPDEQIALPGSNRYHAGGSYDHYIDFPDGFTFGEQTPGRCAAVGEVGGKTYIVTANAIEIDGSTLTQAFMSEAADSIPASDGGTIVEKRTRTIRGEQHVSVIYDVPLQSLRVESVLYPRPHSLVAVSFGVAKTDFDETISFRDELYSRRVGFDPSSP
jgi:serine/threonine protein kinase